MVKEQVHAANGLREFTETNFNQAENILDTDMSQDENMKDKSCNKRQKVSKE